MGSKAAIVNGEVRQPPAKRRNLGAAPKWVGGVRGVWNDFMRFLSDVRAEMRKVVAPSRKEVQTTTSVVIVAVFLFGAFFFVVDFVFGHAMAALMSKLNAFKPACRVAERE
ncbi:MAG: preprotein translocase subunit SecE [Terracidiphilus sp.]